MEDSFYHIQSPELQSSQLLDKRAFTLVTMGDPAGIGLYLTLMAWRKYHNGNNGFCLLAHDGYLEILNRYYRIDVPIQAVQNVQEAKECWPKALPVINICNQIYGQPSKPNNGDVPAILESIEAAFRMCSNDSFDCSLAMLTNPVCKNQLYKQNFAYGGQTEYLAALSGISNKNIAMIFASKQMITMPLTYHVPVSLISSSLDKHMIKYRIKLLNKFLQHMKNVDKPRIALLSMNPHGGEDGYCGMEEKQILNTVAQNLQNQGIDITKSSPMEILFQYQDYHAFVCVYHDQALLPIKMLAHIQKQGVISLTIGLPFVRVSPAHGTAFAMADISQCSKICSKSFDLALEYSWSTKHDYS